MLGQAADVFAAAAFDRPPLMLTRGREQRVVAKEPHQRAGWECADLFGRGGPDRAAYRHQVIALKPIAQRQFLHHLANGGAVIAGHALGAGVEAQDVAYHAKKCGPAKVAALTKQCPHIFQPVFHRTVLDGRAKGHVTAHHRHIQRVEHARQMRVIHIVEDDEPGIHRLIAANARHNRTCMPPEARRGFKQGHVMTWTKEPCGGQTGYATADNGDPAALRGQGIKGHVFSIGFHELTS